MKNRLFKALALALAALLLCGAALAEARTTASVWMRETPSLEGRQVASYAEGKSLAFLGEISVDERGVAWYKVADGDKVGWVSSKYTELIDEEPVAAPAPFEDGEPVELSGYYLSDLLEAAYALALPDYRAVETSEVPNQYYNDSVTIAGYQNVENIVVYGGGYQLFGVSVGMNVINATVALTNAGLDLYDAANIVTFQHRGTESSIFVSEEGYDSCVSLWVDEDGVVTEIDWSSYTG